MADNYEYRESLKPIEQAKETLGARLTYDVRYGYMLDRKPRAISDIIKFADEVRKKRLLLVVNHE